MTTAPMPNPINGATLAQRLVQLLAQPDPMLDEAFLRPYWEMHVLPSPKGRALPLATFEMGALDEVVLEQLEARDGTWASVTNRVLLKSGVMAHWEPDRRRALHAMVDDIGRHIRSAREVSLGNGQKGWRQPVLITPADGNGLVVPIAIVPGDDGIEIRSLITPVTPHRLKELRGRK
jgi:hypothetical protein